MTRLRRAFTLAECVIATAVVATLLVAVLNGVGAVGASRRLTAERARADLLARELMSEIMAQPFEDPAGGNATLGPTAAEALPGNRSLFNDADDYHGLVESPPKNHLGTALSGLTGWTRSVVVERVNPASPTTVVGTDMGAERVTITVSRSNRTLARLTALRTRGMDAAWYFPPGTSAAALSFADATTIGAAP